MKMNNQILLFTIKFILKLFLIYLVFIIIYLLIIDILYKVNYLLVAASAVIIKSNDNKLNIKSVKLYDYLEDSKKIKALKTDNKNKAGIYRLTNKINGEFYIGSSSNLNNRFKAYFAPSGLTKTNRLITQAIIKYGLINFTLEILEYVDVKDNNVLLLKREQYYIDLLEPEYNIQKKVRMPKNYTQYGWKHKEESKILRTLHNNKSIPIYCYKINNNNNNLELLKQFNSLSEASRFLKCGVSSIHYAFTNKNLYKGLYFFTKKLLD
jgi:GIY-YIG catalytic domain